MKTTLLAVGKLRPAYREACDDYLARLRRFGAMGELELKEAPAAKAPTEQLRDEGRRLLDAVPDRATLITLDRI